MPRKSKELTDLAVRKLKESGTYAVGGCDGLALQVLPGNGRSWVLRYAVGKKRREMGLGSYPTLSLADARLEARKARAELREGLDPIEQRRRLRSALEAEQAKVKTFKECAEAYIAAHEASWRNPKHAAQWTATLKTYAYPVIGKLLVGDVEVVHVLKVLEPIWLTKTETAKRLRGRIERVLDWATGRELRKGDNPARWKGLLQDQLAAPGKVAKKKHNPALPLSDMAAFMVHLRKAEGMGARALEFLILAAARTGDVIGGDRDDKPPMTWARVDFGARVWTIPSTKTETELRVPLSDAALSLLRALPRKPGTDLVFPPPREGGTLSNMAMAKVIERMNASRTKAGLSCYVDPKENNRHVVPHGFRSTFMDWAHERTAFPKVVIDMVLAHTVGDKVEAAYRRGDLFEKRRLLMQAWGQFCGQTEDAKVLPMERAKVQV